MTRGVANTGIQILLPSKNARCQVKIPENVRLNHKKLQAASLSLLELGGQVAFLDEASAKLPVPELFEKVKVKSLVVTVTSSHVGVPKIRGTSLGSL